MSYANSSDPFAGIPELDQDCPVSPASGYANAGHAFQAGETKLDDQLFECEKCNGKGTKIIGRVHIRQVECFYCNGTGKRKTSAEHRAKLKATREQNAHDRRQRDLAAFSEWVSGLNEQQTDAIVWFKLHVQNGGYWSKKDIGTSICDQLVGLVKPLSTGQLDFVVKQYVRDLAYQKNKEQERADEAVENAVSDKFAELFAAFAKAHKKLARPIFRVEHIKVSRAPDHGTNAGCLYVKSTYDDYLGKITPSGQFKGKATAEQRESIDALAADPYNAVIKYGRVTGQCGCCGKELTKKQSIEDGIGPICKDKWGF